MKYCTRRVFFSLQKIQFVILEIPDWLACRDCCDQSKIWKNAWKKKEPEKRTFQNFFRFAGFFFAKQYNAGVFFPAKKNQKKTKKRIQQHRCRIATIPQQRKKMETLMAATQDPFPNISAIRTGIMGMDSIQLCAFLEGKYSLTGAQVLGLIRDDITGERFLDLTPKDLEKFGFTPMLACRVAFELGPKPSILKASLEIMPSPPMNAAFTAPVKLPSLPITSHGMFKTERAPIHTPLSVLINEVGKMPSNNPEYETTRRSEDKGVLRTLIPKVGKPVPEVMRRCHDIAVFRDEKFLKNLENGGDAAKKVMDQAITEFKWGKGVVRTCPYLDCTAVFHTKCDMREHFYCKHIKCNPFKCKHCDYNTPFSKKLTRHRKIHGPESPS